MSDSDNGGTSDPTPEEQKRTEDLPDGTVSGDATEDPDQDSDTDSGGEPADPSDGGDAA